MKKLLLNVCILLLTTLCYSQYSDTASTVINDKWSREKANSWYANHNWIVGANFNPSTAINQLEMWQERTFDPETIDKELGYAKEIGFNTMRVYLHSLAYKVDPSGFKNRMETYLQIADKNDIKTMFVIFDDVWGKSPKIGIQPEPKPGVHNSGWVQDPGDPASKELENFPELEMYVKDVIGTFKKDKRILMWDLYNEPGNSGKFSASVNLLNAVFKWAREVNPLQPLTAGIWRWEKRFQEVNEIQALNSDIITYHHYGEPGDHLQVLNLLKTHGRPMVCTEYMARTRNSRFSNILPILKEEKIGAINWGLVAGKTNTIYEWDKPIESGEEPIEWFHDIFRKDGTPYRQDEVDLIKKLTSKD
ncbi:glycoside hydrolase family 2 TIM barrel-domain containing protein [Flavivirga sp. 57AJ16]|uniref:glycoside hydrolase family 2 TIM barrel-domain containing protein n=1 Tax=Flavivirga sp. 57AJ16 TaxID=3025307 RepID=UPI0023653F42|nr:glycoside hydrolase family 2 TIM barrel-domain containing protein [Flavivirga sp. 57AJ16]MDD7885119.1 cellulase family glycosylhydrolase [Flavivirga sp. 57AJ16]